MSDNSIRKPLHIPGRRLVITKRMIENSHENTKSAMEAARWLGVSYNTYKKWAQYYGVFENHKNQKGEGIKKGWGSYKVDMMDILEGKRDVPSNYSLKVFKKRLIDEGYLQDECGVCGWNEKRITDEVTCLNLDFKDGDINNKKFDNLRLICANCYFNNVGDFPSAKKFCK